MTNVKIQLSRALLFSGRSSKNNEWGTPSPPWFRRSLYVGILAGFMVTPSFGAPLNVEGNARINGDIDAVNHTVTNLADPLFDQDAATKGYVDSNSAVIHTSQPNRVALLRWYEIADTERNLNTGTDTAPGAIAFDGEHMWVANDGNDTLIKFHPSDGHVVGTYTIPDLGGPCAPRGLAYDGYAMWVTCSNQNIVRRVRARDGLFYLNHSVGSVPWGIAFDGGRMWVANNDGETVSTIETSSGSIGTVAAPGSPVALAFDGSRMWVTHSGHPYATIIPVDDPTNISTFQIGGIAWGIAFDGENMWIPNSSLNQVVVVAPDLTVVDTMPVGNKPVGVVFDGKNMWVINENDDDADVFRVSDRSLVGSAKVGNRPLFGAFDGANVWITNNGSNTVSKR